jgi:hypothetical protein
LEISKYAFSYWRRRELTLSSNKSLGSEPKHIEFVLSEPPLTNGSILSVIKLGQRLLTKPFE